MKIPKFKALRIAYMILLCTTVHTAHSQSVSNGPDIEKYVIESEGITVYRMNWGIIPGDTTDLIGWAYERTDDNVSIFRHGKWIDIPRSLYNKIESGDISIPQQSPQISESALTGNKFESQKYEEAVAGNIVLDILSQWGGFARNVTETRPFTPEDEADTIKKLQSRAVKNNRLFKKKKIVPHQYNHFDQLIMSVTFDTPASDPKKK